MMNTDAGRLETTDFPGLARLGPAPRPAPAPMAVEGTYAEIMAETERRLLASALQACGGKVVDAARRLGIGRATFYKRMAALKRESRK